MKNIKYIAFGYLEGKLLKSRKFATEQAKDKWCNKFGAQYPEGVVEVFDYATWERCETWAS